MLKAMGIVAVILSCWGTGIYFGWRLRERKTKLSAICLFIKELSDRIRTGAPIEGIISDIGQPAGIYWKELRPDFDVYSLTKSDQKLLSEFLSEIGMGDTVSQVKRCDAYTQLFREQELRAKEQVKEKAGLYAKLGVFSGLFIAVMLV